MCVSGPSFAFAAPLPALHRTSPSRDSLQPIALITALSRLLGPSITKRV